ncbi:MULTISPECIES: ParB/RepB/Spo0J family partition protein [Mesorhizobium]|uniref:ParB/RepB/Spo0J family partition protein n=1 Tax=Mesorhizobium TaxID=68287 RepID=UPI0007EC3A1E|nr:MULTISPECIES: ParB/RepB/Spo0J family partition protein [Mesorhizobium]TPJ37958.1 ParB/RepB/Spo0J family partition protein [Mesorhizobium sp. B2-6-6]ARP67128.1 chromosome partitioning protein ParB [Mesorhizobium sp. WSM1497]MCA0002136.1 ParB/RepB/Spo0J family partition protein [Mesorhizobium sp. B264B2A]MCA0008837.1 ParB/RepB/Spo0J family partition protein [Mesorhizobium sp. B264B1B]MCA0015442.1 ParB/RepB/Spo0J family partition protein [Mesorhizobium sp. B294B1A1]
MQLAHVSIDQLSIAAANMRHSKRAPDIADILPSVRARGVLVPLLVRPNGSPDTFEIVAGRRRYFAAKTVADERGKAAPLPCAIMEDGDDADALEASLIENIARLDPDEVSQWETFSRLIREGRTIADIAATFGLTEHQVKRILALGELLPRIREAYRREEIDAETVRHLTMASKAQQKDWLALFADPDNRAPRGWQLKQWLFGGQSISTKVALFAIEDYPGLIVSDLFGEESYFADADLFWLKQNEAIAATRNAFLEAGWSEVIVLEPSQHFHAWDHEKTPKKKGGKVFISVSHRGEVACHEGWLSHKQARRARANGEAAEAETPDKPSRPEVTGPMQNYVDLHRHAIVRLALLDRPAAALRLMVAHAIAGSSLWQVRTEPQRAANEIVAASLSACKAETAFTDKRREVLALLGEPDEGGAVAGRNGGDFGTASLFAHLLTLSDDDVMRVLGIVMAETLEAGSAVIEALGNHLNVDTAACWQPDDAFFDLLRDREIANSMLAEIGGKHVADGNVAEKVKTQKTIIRDFLSGENGRQKVEAWLPRWMKFPVESYTDRGGLRTADQWARVRSLFDCQ